MKFCGDCANTSCYDLVKIYFPTSRRQNIVFINCIKRVEHHPSDDQQDFSVLTGTCSQVLNFELQQKSALRFFLSTLQRGCFSVWGLILPRRGKRPCRKGKRCRGCGNIIVAAVHCIDSRTIVHREVRIGLTLRIQRKDLRELARSLVRSWCLARVVQGSCLFLLPEESESRERVQVCAAMEITDFRAFAKLNPAMLYMTVGRQSWFVFRSLGCRNYSSVV